MTDNNFSIYSFINSDSLTSSEKNFFKNRYSEMDECNVLVVGATGAGKSSTINAILQKNVATVGVGVNPQTDSVNRYKAGKITFWDTPGLGDGYEADNRSRNAIEQMLEKDRRDGRQFIDVVLIVIESFSRDLGTVVDLINNVVLPGVLYDSEKIVIGANQADMVKDGHCWDRESGKPSEVFEMYFDELSEKIADRISESTGIDINPVVYAAGYTDPESMVQEKSYNISKLVYEIVAATDNIEAEVYNPHFGFYEENESSYFEPLDTVGEVINNVIFEPVDHILGGIIDFFDRIL